MKAQERFDKILIAGASRIQDEVTALVGKPFKLGEPQLGPIDKETFFADLSGKQVLAHVRIEGDVQGIGCLVVGIKDAIFIGGTLIMLPEAELESVMSEQQYSEELQDSYGEVANIICGAATVTFEEQFPKTVRLIRTEQEILLPAKVDVESDQPIADEPYYQISVPMALDEKELGRLYLVLPAEPFGLVEAKQKDAPAPKEAAEKSEKEATQSTETESVGVLERDEAASHSTEDVGVIERPVGEPSAETAAAQPAPRKRDIGKQRKLIDGLIKNCWAKINDEASALLGGTLKVTSLENRPINKEDFIDQAGGKQVVARMDLRGGSEGEAYLFVDLKTAVYLGGCLIMLPESELEETVRNEAFGDDARDAYGEVSNIIAGVFTTIFEEQYRGKLGFVKTAIDPVIPAKIDPESDDVFANHGYYLALGQLHYNERDLGRAQLLVPITAFELEDLLLAGDTAEESPTAPAAIKAPSAGETTSKDPVRLQEKEQAHTDMLIVTDDDREADRIADELESQGFGCQILHFKDPVNAVLTARIQMVFLVMREVSEQGFGVAIKISSSGLPVPLVAAGPAWTRTMVLKAVKYGACDILLTPSTSEDVREKLANNLVKKAA
ncbi:MAG: hypothetical protein PHI97_32775 [Desulfobulbus sp.]|nr:hypothetical protein [Desulfobulbus sp.]